MEQLEYLIDRFIFVMPPVEAPAISVHSCHPPPSLTVQQTVFKETLQHELGPRSRGLHRIICNMRTQFPDLRLIQYDCGKLQTLDRLLRQLKAGSHRVLIFTQMTRMLDVLEQFLNYHGHIYLRLDGSTRVEQRQSLMDRFNADKRIFCFILSTRSGGVGVNLTGADTVIFYDSDWNPTMDAQAQDRCHRIGQTRDVHIYRLISERTVEENILKKANQKRMLGDMAIEGGNFTTAYFRQQTIRDLFEMPTDEGTKKESESTLRSALQEEEDAAPTKQNQILEQALCKAEDEEDIRAATQAKAEQVAELAEFNENIPLDADDGLGREEEEEMSKAEQEIASLVEQLTPIERYAMNFLESSLEDISKEELKQAEEQVEAARKDLDLAKDEVLQLPIDEDEGWTNEESHSKKSKKSKAFNRPERPGTRVSERLRGTRISGMEIEETAHTTSMELLQKKTHPINEPPEKQAVEQTDLDMRKLSGGAQSSPLTIPENVFLQKQDTIKLLAGGKQESERGTILSSQPPSSISDCKQKSPSFSESTLAEEDQQEQLASRTVNVDRVQNERDMVREVHLLQSAHLPSKDSLVKGELSALSGFRSGESQLLLRLPNVSKASQAGALEGMFCDNTTACAVKEGQFQSQNLQRPTIEFSLSKEVGESTSATQEVQPLHPRSEESVPFIKEVEQSEIAEHAEIARETGHPSRKITQPTDLTDLLTTLNDTNTVALEVASVKEIVSSKILCNHMLENFEVNQVVEDPKVNLLTTSRDVSDPSKPVERQRHRRSSQSQKPETLPRVALERLVSLSERTRSESCQVRDGLAGTTDEGKEPPKSTEQKPGTQPNQRLKDLTEPTLCAMPKEVELTSDRDLNTSVSAVEKSNDFPKKNNSQNIQVLSIEADDTPTTKSTRLNDEILITTGQTESVVLHQRFTSTLEAFSSEDSAKLDPTMATVHKEGLLDADIHALSDDIDTENVSINMEKGKSETSSEIKQLVCDEVVLCKGSTSHLALDESALCKEIFDRLPVCEVQLYKEKLYPLLLHDVASSEGSIPSAKTCDMKVRVGHQYVEEVSENTRHPPCRSSLETSAPSEEGVEATTDQLKQSPPRTPRRRTNADGEILQNQKDDDSPTAKVLRKLPGRIVTIVEDRLPVKRKRKSSRSQNSDSLVSLAECSANCTSDAENSMKESPAARDNHTKRMWQSTKEPAEGSVLQHSKDLPDHQTTKPPETKMMQQISLPANQFPTILKPDKVSGTLVKIDSSHSMSMISVSSTNTRSRLALSTDSQVEILSPCLKRKRGRPRKIKPEDSPDCQSPVPMCPDNELPETVLPPSKCPEPASEGNNAEQSIFPTCNSQGNNFPDSTSPIQSPVQETSRLSETSACTDAVKNHNKAKPCELEFSVSSKGNKKSVDPKTEKSQDEEVQLRKKGSPKKGSPDQTGVESEDQSDNSLPLDKPRPGRPPKLRETNIDLSPLSSCFSLVATNENITCPISVSETAPLPNIFTYSSSTPMGVTDVSFTHSTDSSSTSAHASSTDAKVSTDGSCTPGRDSTDASFTPARIPATNVSTFARVSTDDSSSTPKIKTDTCPTTPKRKRGRPPKMQSPSPEEQCSLPSASEQESSLDEAKNLKQPAKRTTRKKRRVRAEENVASQSQLSDSETSSSSSSESPPLTRLARYKMESSGQRDVKDMQSWGDSSSQTALSIQSPATQMDSDCERLQLLSSKLDANLQSKTAECTIYPRSKNDVPLLKKLDHSSSQDSSMSEIKSPRSEVIPRGRCTRNTPSESLVPALESEKDILRKVRHQSCIETSVRQSKMRTDSEVESTSEEDSTRPSKRLRGESERTRKSQGQSTAPESVADRILRSVAAAAAAAAMSPASNTRSSAVTSPPPSTQSPSLVRKFGSQNITTLGNRGRKPKT